MGKRASVWQNSELVAEAFHGAHSMSEILTKLGQPLGSAGYQSVRLYAKKYGLDVPQYKPNGASFRGKTTRPLSELLVEDSEYRNRQGLKKRLIRELGWIDRCAMPNCPNPEPTWNGRPLVLHLDHINGNGTDNRVENLRFLCPNCHSQTDTFGFRGSRDRIPKKVICDCGNSAPTTGRCRSCAAKSRNHRAGKTKITWPTIEETVVGVQTHGYSAYAKTLGVSDVAVRKFLQKNSVDLTTIKC